MDVVESQVAVLSFDSPREGSTIALDVKDVDFVTGGELGVSLPVWAFPGTFFDEKGCVHQEQWWTRARSFRSALCLPQLVPPEEPNEGDRELFRSESHLDTSRTMVNTLTYKYQALPEATVRRRGLVGNLSTKMDVDSIWDNAERKLCKDMRKFVEDVYPVPSCSQRRVWTHLAGFVGLARAVQVRASETDTVVSMACEDTLGTSSLWESQIAHCFGLVRSDPWLGSDVTLAAHYEDDPRVTFAPEASLFVWRELMAVATKSGSGERHKVDSGKIVVEYLKKALDRAKSDKKTVHSFEPFFVARGLFLLWQSEALHYSTWNVSKTQSFWMPFLGLCLGDVEWNVDALRRVCDEWTTVSTPIRPVSFSTESPEGEGGFLMEESTTSFGRTKRGRSDSLGSFMSLSDPKRLHESPTLLPLPGWVDIPSSQDAKTDDDGMGIPPFPLEEPSSFGPVSREEDSLENPPPWCLSQSPVPFDFLFSWA